MLYYRRLIGTHYVLYRMVLFRLTVSDPKLPKSAPFSTFVVAFPVFVTGAATDHIGTSVYHSKFHPIQMTNCDE